MNKEWTKRKGKRERKKKRKKGSKKSKKKYLQAEVLQCIQNSRDCRWKTLFEFPIREFLSSVF